MAIAKNATGGGGKFISEPGEYIVEISDVQFGKSKKGDPMVTVTFLTEDEKSIRAFFVKKHDFMMKQLNLLKIGCGISADAPSDELVGRRCGIKVELGRPSESGTRFPQIVGYGKTTEVEHHPIEAPTSHADAEHIPF